MLDTSDVPGGVVNIVTGEANALAADARRARRRRRGLVRRRRGRRGEGRGRLRRQPQSDLDARPLVDWPAAEGREFLRRATQIKTIWTPYGE